MLFIISIFADGLINFSEQSFITPIPLGLLSEIPNLLGTVSGLWITKS